MREYLEEEKNKSNNIKWVWVVITNTQKQILTTIESNSRNKIWKKKWQKGIIFGEKKNSETTRENAIRETQEETWISNFFNLDYCWTVNLEVKTQSEKIKISIEIFNMLTNFRLEELHCIDDEIVRFEVLRLQEIIKKREENPRIIRPLTIESLYTYYFWWTINLSLYKSNSWIYDDNYMKEIQEIINQLKKIKFTPYEKTNATC